MTSEKDPGFFPADFEGPDEHDELSGDLLSWEPAAVLDVPENSVEALEVMAYWLDRHQIVDATEEILAAFAKLDVGAVWLRCQGWRFADLHHDDIIFMRRQTYENLSDDLQQAWSAQFESADEAARTILRDWRQELRKCALWLLAGDPLDALKVCMFTRAEFGDATSPAMLQAEQDLFENMEKVVGSAVHDADWLIESYVLMSSVAETDGLFRHKEPNKVLEPREPQTLTPDDTETS